MAKRKIEIQEPEVEVAQLIDLDETGSPAKRARPLP